MGAGWGGLGASHLRSAQVCTGQLLCPAPPSCTQWAAPSLWHLSPYCRGHPNLNWKLHDHTGLLPGLASCWGQKEEGSHCLGHKWTSIKTNSQKGGGPVPAACVSPDSASSLTKGALRPDKALSLRTLLGTESRPLPTDSHWPSMPPSEWLYNAGL